MKKLNLHGLRRPLSVLILMASDAAGLVLGIVAAAYLVRGGLSVGEVWLYAPVLLAFWISIFAAHDLYDRATKRRDAGALLGAIMVGTGVFTFGSIVYPQINFKLPETLLAAILVLVACGGARFLYEGAIERIYRRGLGRAPVLVVGPEEARRRVRETMEALPSAYQSVGELSLDNGKIDLALLRKTLDETGARDVILAGAEHLEDEDLLNLLRSMRLRKVQVKVLPGAITLMGARPVLMEDAGLPLLEVGFPQLDNTQRALKRTLDVVGSSLGLLFLSPFLLGVAIAIRIDSPGPIFFKQKRIGADEEVFLCYKFRSMYVDAERRQAELEARNEADGAVFKIQDDPRVTSIGNFIRRWSVDELPQLINVLLGEMSLVGPRPLPIRDFERMTERHKMRLAAIPGMSGYWQVSGRSDLSFEDMVRLDLFYIENWSLGLDMKIIARTVRAVLVQKGAY